MTKRPAVPDAGAEWLEADGLGGFASGTVGGLRTRRSHALLLSARRPPADRLALVSGLDAWVEKGAKRTHCATGMQTLMTVVGRAGVKD